MNCQPETAEITQQSAVKISMTRNNKVLELPPESGTIIFLVLHLFDPYFLCVFFSNYFIYCVLFCRF